MELIIDKELWGGVNDDNLEVVGQRDTVFEIEIQQICCISDGSKLAGAL
jgi:hypothetical protein